MTNADFSPDGQRLSWNESSLLLNGDPWMPVMGELHYTRIPEHQWRSVLLKMKAGGLEVVASYVFWIHHEECEGQWDWSGRRNLRAFIETCTDVGLKTVVRCGPWCHGEVRNGGLPDWLLNKPWPVREDNHEYFDRVRVLYKQIQSQLQGLLWKDGGPVVGVQIENEYAGPAEHLLQLLEIAIESGLHVPYYTRTGWPALKTPMPYGKLIPLFGVYAEGFWDRELTSMPGTYSEGFRFSSRRTEAAIGTDQLGGRVASDEEDAHRYPYCTCEIGGGMMNSYHRRILIDNKDIESTALVKVGSGGNLPGYYMFSGGINPDGLNSSLQESLDTGYPNDLPVKSYDFQAPIGAAGQLRPHYFGLRRMHTLTQELGSKLASMKPVFNLTDRSIDFPQVALRSDGETALLFVNHYERGKALGVGNLSPLQVCLGGDTINFPDQPKQIPDGSSFIWPLRLELGFGFRLEWITAQPLCSLEDADTRTWFFAETPAVPVRLATLTEDGELHVEDLSVGREASKVIYLGSMQIRIVVLSDADARMLSKQTLAGRDRVFLCPDSLVTDGLSLHLEGIGKKELWMAAVPALSPDCAIPKDLQIDNDGIFEVLKLDCSQAVTKEVAVSCLRSAREPSSVEWKGRPDSRVPAAPEEEAYCRSGRWRLELEQARGEDTSGLLRIAYIGDVLRVFVDGNLVYDDFFNGQVVELDPGWWEGWTAASIVEVEILPLSADSPVYMAQGLKPESGWHADLKSVQWLPQVGFSLSSQ